MHMSVATMGLSRHAHITHVAALQLACRACHASTGLMASGMHADIQSAWDQWASMTGCFIQVGWTAHDPEMSCTGFPSRTNLSCAIVKFPAAARPARQQRAAKAAARPTGILHGKHDAHMLLECKDNMALCCDLGVQDSSNKAACAWY